MNIRKKFLLNMIVSLFFLILIFSVAFMASRSKIMHTGYNDLKGIQELKQTAITLENDVYAQAFSHLLVHHPITSFFQDPHNETIKTNLLSGFSPNTLPFDELYLLLPSGELTPILGNENLTAEHRHEILQNKEILNPAFSFVVESIRTNDSLYAIMVYEITDGNKKLGLFLAAKDLELISEILDKKYDLSQTEQTYLIRPTGTLLVHPQMGQENFTFIPPENLAEFCQPNKQGSITYVREKTSYYAVYRWMSEYDSCLITEEEAKHFLYMSRSFLRTILIVLILFIISGYIAFKFINSAMTKPLNQLTELTNRITKGDFSPVKIDSEDFKDINIAFNHLLHLIKKHQKKLLLIEEEKQKELQKEVKKRTRDLEQAVEESNRSKRAVLNMLEDLEEKNQHLKDLDQAKSDFLNVVSHELKTPLTAIIAYLEILEDSEKKLNKSEKTSFYAIRRNANGLRTLIENILEVARIQSEKFQLNISPFILDDVIDSVLTNHEIIAKKKNVSIRVKKKPLPQIYLDDARVKEIINNLVSNAIKFTEKGRVTIHIRRYNTHFFILAVEDTGIGIPEEKQQHLFEKFYQVDGTIGRRYGGSGLGLSITKELVELQGGAISVQTKEGKGSTFVALLPLKYAEKNKKTPPKNFVEQALLLLSGKEKRKDIKKPTTQKKKITKKSRNQTTKRR